MAAKFHVRLRGKVHGPFSSAQLKQLAGKGKITEEAEIRQVGGDKWYPATRVAGLFDDAAKSGSGVSKKSAGSSGASSRSGAGKRPARKKKPVVDASDVFDLNDDADEDLDDVEFFEDEEYDEPEFIDDDPYERPASRSSRSSGTSRRSSRRSGGTSWGQVRIGLLLVGIATCILAGSFAMQAIGELIMLPMSASLATGGGSLPSRTTVKLLDLLSNGSVLIAPLGNIVAIVGFSLAVFLPPTRGAKGLAIAALATFSVHTILHFVYFVAPVLDRDGRTFRMQGLASSDFPVEMCLTWTPLYAALILTSLTIAAVGALRSDRYLEEVARKNLWLIGIFVGVYIVSWLFGKIADTADFDLDVGRAGLKAIIWLGVLFRLAHLGVYGTYIGRLIPQSFEAKSLA